MVPEIVRLERAGVCGCGELVGAGERAGYAPPQERVVCLTCLSAESARPEADDASRATAAVLPAIWTADELVIAATLKALRERSSSTRRPSGPEVLHVPTEWSSTPFSGPAPIVGPDETAPPEQLIILPRRKPRIDPVRDAELAGPSAPTAPTAFLPPAQQPAVPQAVPQAAPPVAPAASAAVTQTIAQSIAATETRRSRHAASAAEEQSMPASAPRRRAGLFTRLLTVRAFRTQQAQPKVSKAHAAVSELLGAATTKGVVSLHNRRVPGRRGRIEHIAIGAGGVYVIDALHFKNASIEVRPAGEPDAASDDLVVGGRVLTPAVRAIAQRVEVLRLILVAAGLPDVPVTGALCFVDGLLPLAVADLEVGGMHVLRPSGLTALVAGSGPYGPDDRDTLRDFLAERLPAVA